MKLPTHASRSADNEAARLLVVWNRDGKDAALAWARQTVQIYKNALLDPDHYASKSEYKSSFKSSVVALEALLQLDAEGRMDETLRIHASGSDRADGHP